jgi:hypothetical protein
VERAALELVIQGAQTEHASIEILHRTLLVIIFILQGRSTKPSIHYPHSGIAAAQNDKHE